jgi:NADPH-dependent 2,4-dienoyl-CoA reductase/sulfur reductase-like enzyme/nitrite reductase/ring-hydroxylating ferredoxin subunit
MGSTNEGPKGPDLATGVSAASLKDGEPLLGHVGDDAVIVVKRGAEIFAVSATCTHYGGPLAEGLVVGDTIRCPWHHASFNLRTGRVLAPPARDHLTCFAVERDGDKVRVRSNRAVPQNIVIVGGGPAAQVAAETLRDEGFSGAIAMVSAEAATPTDRPNLSKEYLSGEAPAEYVPLRPAEYYAEKKIALYLSTQVTKIDTAARKVELSSGQSLSYDGLLLATGASPIKLDIPGADDARLHYLRTTADSDAIIAAAQKGKRAVVIGASFIGLEVAASLRTRGLEVDVVAPDPVPLNRVMGPVVGHFVKMVHEGKGVHFHLGHTVKAIEPSGVVLDDGTKLEADLIVAGIGVRPELQLAADAGLKIDRGIVVDAYLETSAPGVYAAGDVARYPDPTTGTPVRIEHFAVAERHGRIAALNFLGRRERCAFVPFFWSHHHGVGISYVGHAEQWDDVVIDGTLDPAAPNARIEYRHKGKVVAVATVNRDRESLKAEATLEAELHT